MDVLNGKKVVLGVGGGIAAYKSCQLVRDLKARGADVRVVMTPAATEFVQPLTFQALSGHPVHTSLFSAEQEHAMGHIDLARWADVFLVAPATADLIARLAAGMGDDLVATTALATRAPIVLSPAMNTVMWENPVVQDNLRRFSGYPGRLIIPPSEGELACGEVGPGRMPDSAILMEWTAKALSPQDWRGRKVLITAGPTREEFDPVRFISNYSSGKMGAAIASAAWRRGAEVTLVLGPSQVQPPPGARVIRVQTAREMYDGVMNQISGADAAIFAAAVADFRPANRAAHKIKKMGEERVTIELERNPDILAAAAALMERPVIVGFAAETDNLEENARRKLQSKQADLIAANLVSEEGIGFNTDDNRMTLYFSSGDKEELPRAPKTAIADHLLDRVRRLVETRRGR
ncbi:MAG: Coenzyme A biosynthesis bifunctional protein CoaBC [Myxococcota bacterium]|nr:Coenzyme A biosynthesis bifunctional protein CoaBC [Myxococcota bacterium]